MSQQKEHRRWTFTPTVVKLRAGPKDSFTLAKLAVKTHDTGTVAVLALGDTTHQIKVALVNSIQDKYSHFCGHFGQHFLPNLRQRKCRLRN
jgi:hypothetical protein